MKKSICCIALALVMAMSTVGLFASCTKEKEKTLVMATNANFPPYEYKDGAAFAGIDVELADEAFRRMGGFDEGYFMYVEDADITRKAQEYGKVMYVPEAHVYHAWHRDTKKKWKNFWMQIRSMLRYWRKWGFRMD